MAFRGTRQAIRAYEIVKGTVKEVTAVTTEQGEVKYYRVTTSLGVVNLGPKGVDELQKRYDFDSINDIVGQDLDFRFIPNNDTRYGDFQLAFVLGRVVEGIAPQPQEQGGGLEF